MLVPRSLHVDLYIGTALVGGGRSPIRSVEVESLALDGAVRALAQAAGLDWRECHTRQIADLPHWAPAWTLHHGDQLVGPILAERFS